MWFYFYFVKEISKCTAVIGHIFTTVPNAQTHDSITYTKLDIVNARYPKDIGILNANQIISLHFLREYVAR